MKTLLFFLFAISVFVACTPAKDSEWVWAYRRSTLSGRCYEIGEYSHNFNTAVAVAALAPDAACDK